MINTITITLYCIIAVGSMLGNYDEYDSFDDWGLNILCGCLWPIQITALITRWLRINT